MDNNTLLISDDGSPTLKSNRYGVTYHSIFGAIHEAITVFVSAGLQYHILSGKKEISILEMGLGTGLNAFLTFVEANRHPISVAYTAIEKFPIDNSLIELLDYPDQINHPHLQHLFKKIHSCPFSTINQIHNCFSLQKLLIDVQHLNIEKKFDLIYYDAFAPNAQPELWTDEAMKGMFEINKPGGTLVTYCAKGSFKRALKSAGYLVQPLPGPPGKREMTRAIKPG